MEILELGLMDCQDWNELPLDKHRHLQSGCRHLFFINITYQLFLYSLILASRLRDFAS